MDEQAEVNCEIRRLCSWFNEKFYREVTKIIIDEKVIRFAQNLGGARSEFLRAAKLNFTHHMNYISSLLELKSFLAKETVSTADITAACHLSVMDYFGEIAWDKWPAVKNWYSILKSRPSFRPLLQDHVPGFVPSASYADLDF
jgi:glutathione S-transferase